MSRIASKKPYRMEFSDGDWIDIRRSLTMNEIEPLLSLNGESQAEQVKAALKIAEIAIIGWNLKDDEGNPVPYDPARITDLDLKTLFELQAKFAELYFPAKKDLAA